MIYVIVGLAVVTTVALTCLGLVLGFSAGYRTAQKEVDERVANAAAYLGYGAGIEDANKVSDMSPGGLN